MKYKDETLLSRSQDSKHPVKRLLVFQVKLAVDALRDIILSPVSLICTLLDYFQKKSGKNSYFEKLMVFGRQTEKRINLFEQHQIETSFNKNASIDTVLNRVESVILREYKEKHISKKTLSAIETALKNDKK
ncbi:MAG: hypothetical protein COB38_02865 [Gammaproteobacteria bacterium]|nr:MAG: hypothetical protein COB38_02865 [Gammaproteobacteria bacterium]